MANLTLQLHLDALDAKFATYKGPNMSCALIDRAVFLGQSRPTSVTVTVPNSEEHERGQGT
jgi:hypothetical protein